MIGDHRTEEFVDTGLHYRPGEPVRVRVVHREHRISVSDDGAAVARFGHATGTGTAATKVLAEFDVNISTGGIVSLPVVPVGPSFDEVVRRIGEASLALYQELLDG